MVTGLGYMLHKPRHQSKWLVEVEIPGDRDQMVLCGGDRAWRSEDELVMNFRS